MSCILQASDRFFSGLTRQLIQHTLFIFSYPANYQKKRLSGFNSCIWHLETFLLSYKRLTVSFPVWRVSWFISTLFIFSNPANYQMKWLSWLSPCIWHVETFLLFYKRPTVSFPVWRVNWFITTLFIFSNPANRQKKRLSGLSPCIWHFELVEGLKSKV